MLRPFLFREIIEPELPFTNKWRKPEGVISQPRSRLLLAFMSSKV